MSARARRLGAHVALALAPALALALAPALAPALAAPITPEALPCVACHPGAVSARALPFSAPASCDPCHASPPSAALPPTHLPAHIHDARATPQRQPLAHIDHRAHLTLGLTCGECHAGRGAGRGGDGCVTCHAARGASVQCDICHIEQVGPRLRALWPSGAALSPRGGHGGADHRGDFRRDHAAAARLEPDACARCHAPSACEACHAGGRAPLAVHPPDYTQTHGVSALGGSPPSGCGGCHEPTRDCAPCHQRSGLHTRAGDLSFSLLPSQRARAHPPGFERAHGAEATRGLEGCVSCHSERDCVRCHGASAPTPTRASPHRQPPCATPDRADDLSCVACHGARRVTLCGGR